MAKPNSTPTPTPPKKSNGLLVWGITLLILLVGLAYVFTQFTSTASSLFGGGNISTPEGTRALQQNLQKVGLENVSVVTTGKTTTIAFKVPANPEALLQDKATLAQLALQVAGLPDDQVVIVQAEGHKTITTTGKQAKELAQQAIASGGNIDPATVAQYVKQNEQG